MEQIKYNVIRKFGPPIFKVSIPENIVKIINVYIDEIINDKEKIKK